VIGQASKVLAILFLALSAGCLAETPSDKVDNDFDRKVINFLSAIADNSRNASGMVDQVRSMEMVSGEMKNENFRKFATIKKSYRMQSLDFYASHAELRMVGLKPANQSCYDRLVIWIYPANTKMDLKYMIEKEGYCITPVDINLPSTRSN
jgi:hypothetical protein